MMRAEGVSGIRWTLWRSRARFPPGRAEGGSVTAEIAVALPALMLVTVAALWGITAASAQIACVDAVRAGARAAARGEPLPAVRAVVERAAPPGARVEVRRGRETTEVAVRVVLRPPALTGFPALTMRAHALAATEPGVE
jgi:TadE-like protein